MDLGSELKQLQKLTLSPQIQLNLRCLQLSALQLDSFLHEAALSNPLIDYESTPFPPVNAEAPEPAVSVSHYEAHSGSAAPDADWNGIENIATSRTLSDYLIWQLTNIRSFDERLYPACVFLIHCLNSDGYLDCPLDELAQECGCPLFDLEQALFVIQTLDPPGIGARDLTECLLLQLAQTSHFSASTVHLIRYGLPLLAQRDYKGLSALLELPERDVKAAAGVIRSLNPIPSNGFASQTPQPYAVPEAVIHRDGGRLSVELYARRWRRLSCNRAYLSMIGSAAYHEAQDYLKQKKREAEELIAAVEGRDQLIQQIIEYIVSTQGPHLLSGQPLQPMTMSDLAQALRVNVSTISRAIREKYILLDTKVILLRSLFSARLETSSGTAVSAEYAKMQVKRIIDAEDKAVPLSDQAISEAMQGMGVPLSRRTVASYRSQMGIPGTQKRKIPK